MVSSTYVLKRGSCCDVERQVSGYVQRSLIGEQSQRADDARAEEEGTNDVEQFALFVKGYNVLETVQVRLEDHFLSLFCSLFFQLFVQLTSVI